MVKYQELWNEENTNIRERYDLAMERILEIPSEERVAEPYRSYFNQMAAFTAQIEELARLQLREDLDAFTLEELQQLNDRLYADILPEHTLRVMRIRPMPCGCWGQTLARCFLLFTHSFGQRLSLPTSAD